MTYQHSPWQRWYHRLPHAPISGRRPRGGIRLPHHPTATKRSARHPAMLPPTPSGSCKGFFSFAAQHNAAPHRASHRSRHAPEAWPMPCPGSQRSTLWHFVTARNLAAHAHNKESIRSRLFKGYKPIGHKKACWRSPAGCWHDVPGQCRQPMRRPRSPHARRIPPSSGQSRPRAPH